MEEAQRHTDALINIIRELSASNEEHKARVCGLEALLAAEASAAESNAAAAESLAAAESQAAALKTENEKLTSRVAELEDDARSMRKVSNVVMLETKWRG